MGKINDTTEYPTVTPATNDLVIGTDKSDVSNDPDGETVNFTVSSILGVQHDHTLSDVTDAGTAAGLDETTAAQFRSNTADKVLSTDQVWSAASEVTLTDGANIVFDLSTGINFAVTLAGNRTMNNPTNAKVGQSGFVRIVQDATGGRTLTFSANWYFAGGTAPTLSTAANAEDVLFYTVLSSTKTVASLVKDIS